MTQTLCTIGMRGWDTLHGYCVAYKIKWDRLTPDEFASLVFWYWTRNMSAEDHAKFVREIEKPPPGVNPAKGMWSNEATLAQFKSAMMSVG